MLSVFLALTKSTSLKVLLRSAAVWVISQSSEGHGRIWAGWMQRVHRLYPGFDLSTRHGYEIHKPFRWQCEACSSFEERHSKSMKDDTACRVCGTKGRLTYLGKFEKDGTPAKQRQPSAFAQFTKDHMSEVTASLPAGTPHKVKMEEMGRRWREHKEALVQLRAEAATFLDAAVSPAPEQ